jgi:hypothetical protein
MLARRTQHHQDRLATRLTAADPTLRAAIARLSRWLVQRGVTNADARRLAFGRIGDELSRQALALAYVDVIWVLAVVAAFMVPVAMIFVSSRPSSRGAPGGV